MRERGGSGAEPGYYRKPGGLPIRGQHANLAESSEQFYALAPAPSRTWESPRELEIDVHPVAGVYGETIHRKVPQELEEGAQQKEWGGE
jgi:hypothetical protein